MDYDAGDEIVVGFGQGGGGWIYVIDDAATNYAAFATPTPGGWLRRHFSNYNTTNGAVYPALGNLDIDSADEIVLGGGTGNGGWIQVLDDGQSGFKPFAKVSASGWTQLRWAGYNSANGTVWPSICDGAASLYTGQIVFGLGEGGGGWLQAFEVGATFAPATYTSNSGGWMRAASPTYNAAQGEVRAACANLPDDLFGPERPYLAYGKGGLGQYEIEGVVRQTSYLPMRQASGGLFPAYRRPYFFDPGGVIINGN